jgi:hypothetical protein
MPKLDPKEVIGYYRALGEFVELFADVEGVLFLYLYTLVGVDEATAKAVFSGVRVHEAISFIRRLAEVRTHGIPATIDAVLAQLLIINDARNMILHNSMSPTYSKGRLVRTISNIDRALTELRIKEIPISEEVIMRMCDDLFRIKAFFFHEYACLVVPAEDRGPFDRLGPVPVGAWLYKPAPRSTKATRAPRDRPARQTPPDESSRE